MGLKFPIGTEVRQKVRIGECQYNAHRVPTEPWPQAKTTSACREEQEVSVGSERFRLDGRKVVVTGGGRGMATPLHRQPRAPVPRLRS